MSWLITKKKDGTYRAECRHGNKVIRYENVVVTPWRENEVSQNNQIIVNAIANIAVNEKPNE